MDKSKIEVFTSPTCPYCPSAVKVANEVAKERADVIVEELDTYSDEGSRKALQFQVMTVPTVFVNGPMHNEILAISGVPSKEKLNELVDISQGKKIIREEKPFLTRFWEKIKGLD